MIIYNVTCSMDPSVSEEWLQWMKDVHIPDVIKCGIFKKAQINKVLSEKDGEITYAIQYSCENMKDYHHYETKLAPQLQQKHTQKYGNKIVAFRTLLEVVEKF